MKENKLFALMLFYAPEELGVEDCNESFCDPIIRTYSDKVDAMMAYANTQCPASQLIEANSQEELEVLIEQMKNNYKDEDWLETNLYPYL